MSPNDLFVVGMAGIGFLAGYGVRAMRVPKTETITVPHTVAPGGGEWVAPPGKWEEHEQQIADLYQKHSDLYTKLWAKEQKWDDAAKQSLAPYSDAGKLPVVGKTKAPQKNRRLRKRAYTKRNVAYWGKK